jgi:transposase
MMGRQNNDHGPLFYKFCLDKAVPDDHLARQIDAVLDLSWVHAELAPYYPTLGRPSVGPVLMIRMLVIRYVFALRSERLLCREVQVNFAYRWFCRLGIEHKIPDHSVFLRPRLRRFVPRFESIHADMAAELVLASSGMMTPFPCAIFLAYSICFGLAGLGVTFPAVPPSAFLGACWLRNARQIEIDVL